GRLGAGDSGNRARLVQGATRGRRAHAESDHSNWFRRPASRAETRLAGALADQGYGDEGSPSLSKALLARRGLERAIVHGAGTLLLVNRQLASGRVTSTDTCLCR